MMTPDSKCSYPIPRAVPTEPPEQYRRLRREAPVCPVILASGYPAYLVTRYADVKHVLADPRFSLAAVFHPDAPRLTPVQQPPGSLLSLDPPQHTRLRSTVARAFAPARIQQLRGRIEQVTDELLETLTSEPRPADLNALLAIPLPVTIISELLGIPAGDREQVRGWATTLMGSAPDVLPPSDASLADTYRAIGNYFGKLVAIRRRAPSDDLLSSLIATDVGGNGQLSDYEVVVMGMTLFLAGNESTATFLSLAVLRLLRQPELYARLREQPELLPTCVDEMLRLDAHGGALVRMTTEEVELAGVLIPPGSTVIPAIDAANRDETQFGSADNLVIDRTENPHLTFGHGPHYCLGAPLARLEIEVALESLVRRIPTLRLAIPPENLTWRNTLAGGPTQLPVTW